MPSLSKSESARINGAKSHGPKTEAGRKRSSQNALKHGLTSQTLVLPSEDPDEFNQLLTSYLDQFQPRSPAELHLVHEMVAAKWRLERLAIIETQLYVDYLEHAEEDADDPLSPTESLTAAFTRLANSNSYPFLQRVEARLERTYSRALRNLIQLQRQSSGENKICTNEPTATHPQPSPPSSAPPPPPATTQPPQLAWQPTPQSSVPSHSLATILVYVPRIRTYRHCLARPQETGRLVRPAPRLPHQPHLRRQLLCARG